MIRSPTEGRLGQAQTKLEFTTPGRGFTDITQDVQHWLHEIGAEAGTITIFLQHTSASLVIQENTDADVQSDLADALAVLAPEGRRWRHALEGQDDMPAHIKTMLTHTSLVIPVTDGRLTLGTWQAVYLAEHRSAAHRRQIVLAWIGAMRA